MGNSQLKPRTGPTAGLILLRFGEELEVHLLPSFHPNPPFSLPQSHPTGSNLTAGGAAAPGGRIWCRAKAELPRSIYLGRGERKQMYVHIHSVTYVSSQKKAP